MWNCARSAPYRMPFFHKLLASHREGQQQHPATLLSC
jgi:hypothetical protein